MIDSFCHILPPRFEKARWARGGKEFATHSPAHLAYLREGKAPPNYEGLIDLDGRFRMMDEIGENYRQIISIAGPPPEVIAPDHTVELSSIVNDEFAELVAKYPTRFAGAVGTLPMNEPDRACREVERLATELKLNGVQIFTNVGGKPLDAPEFRPIFDTLAKYHVPIILHPARSKQDTDYPTEETSKYLIWQVFGWPFATTVAMARLVFSGMMERYPDIKILCHHTGAMIPFFSGRMKSMFTVFQKDLAIESGGLAAEPLDYFRRFYADTAAFTPEAVNCARAFLGADHVVFGTDAPFDATGGRSSIRASIAAVRQSACTKQEAEKIFDENVERFFSLGVTASR